MLMRAVVYEKYGPPEVLRIDDVERPVPKDDEVLVRTHATTVTRADCATREANRRSGLAAATFSRLAFGVLRPRQRILGSEFAGEVVAIGGTVRSFAVGDCVFGTSGLRFGAHAEFICLREDAALAHMPAGVSFEQAVAICDGGLNALTSLRRVGLREGQRILVYGASGSIGTAAVQLAKVLDADVTAACSTRKVQAVRSLGADRVIDYRRNDFTRSGESYDVIFDAVGKQSFRRCRGSLRHGGTYIATDGLFNLVLSLVPRGPAAGGWCSRCPKSRTRACATSGSWSRPGDIGRSSTGSTRSRTSSRRRGTSRLSTRPGTSFWLSATPVNPEQTVEAARSVGVYAVARGR